MLRSLAYPAAWLGVLLGCASPKPAHAPVFIPKPAQAAAAPAASTPRELLAQGRDALLHTHFAKAEQRFLAATADPTLAAEATLGLAETQFATGRYDQAARTAAGLTETAHEGAARLIAGRAHFARGRYDEATATLAPALVAPNAYEARILAAELHLAVGRRLDAEALLMEIIEAYNSDRIAPTDGPALSAVGQAAFLLRSPEDANDAFNEAEQILVGHVPTLIRRAIVYLDNYDGAHAGEVLDEALEIAPNHPDVLSLQAKLQLVDALNFDEATRLTDLALTQNPNLGLAYAVQTSIALHDNHYERADELVARGLSINPANLELLSLAAAVRFLQDDQRGYERAKVKVFEVNPAYSTFFQIVGDFGEWEHRYSDIASMMREAIAIDDDDAKAHAELGLNLIRLGDDAGGVRSLRRAFAKDPLNVRVYNTLELYEEVIPKEYEDVEGDPFRIRYPKDERGILERYVPKLMAEAFHTFQERHGFTPTTPIGVELYSDRRHFAVRTSGLPRTAIQGVCFGKTLAAMTPRNEQFNQSLTLWHELAHVFHIQLSRSRVPRWFTEGLAEYESSLARPEWKREHDQDLYRALRAGRLPRLAAMNEAFTHAEDLLDVTVAYYASFHIVGMLAEQYGMPALTQMLRLWGEGLSSEEVFLTALSASPTQLDEAFARYLEQRLSRYATQFVPDDRLGAPDAVIDAAKRRPRDPAAQVKRALLGLHEGDEATALAAIGRALRLAPSDPNALWVDGTIALSQKDSARALQRADALLQSKHDGYATQMLLAEGRALGKKPAGALVALNAAHAFDPEEAKPLAHMLPYARELHDSGLMEKLLSKLAVLEEHDGSSALGLCRLLLKEGNVPGAVAAGELAIMADLESAAAHLYYGRALAAAGDQAAARFEWESAVRCPGPAAARAEAEAALAGALPKSP